MSDKSKPLLRLFNFSILSGISMECHFIEPRSFNFIPCIFRIPGRIVVS